MREVATGLRPLVAIGRLFTLVTTVGVRSSSPRPLRTVLAVDVDGIALGSLSRGWVESGIYTAGEEVLAAGVPAIEIYWINGDEAFAFEFTCGGVLEVLVQRVDESSRGLLADVLDALDADRPVPLATIVDGPAPLGARLVVYQHRVADTLGDAGLDQTVDDGARRLLVIGQAETRHYGAHGEHRVDEVPVFIQAFSPLPRMLVFGAIDFAAAVVRLGVFLGFRVTVCDARAIFATEARFPDAHEVVCVWPHDYLADIRVDQRTVVCVLTHDSKLDIPLLEVALRTPAGYIGAMGSRRTHARWLAGPRERGLTDAELAPLRAPIGLDIGARATEETAISMAADIIQTRWGGTGLPLSVTGGAIHAGVREAEVMA